MSVLEDRDCAVEVALAVRSDRVVVAVRGEIDLATVGQFASALDEAVRCSRRVLVDFTGTTFMDSSGLRVLVDAYQTLNRDPGALVIRAPRQVGRLLRFEGLDHLVEAGPAWH